MIVTTRILQGFRGISDKKDMSLRFLAATLILVVIPFLGSCNDNNFAGSGSKGSAAKDAADPDCGQTADPDAAANPPCDPQSRDEFPTPSECVEGDKVNIQWAGPVKDCLGQGKTYNYEEQKCAEMRQSQFDCNWKNVVAELDKRHLLTNVLKTDSGNGSKLVSCGQAADGNRIVVQWIKANDAQDIDCTDGASSHHITTGCYTVYTSANDQPPNAKDEKERSAQVYACMNEL